MVPVPPDHPVHILTCALLPLLVADVLPTGNLLEDQQPDLVAGVQEVRRLWVVRGPDDVALDLVLENQGILALDTGRHRAADVRKGLVAVEAAQLDAAAVQEEAFWGEAGVAEPEADLVAIQHCALIARAERLQRDDRPIEGWPVQVPEIDAVQITDGEVER